MSGVAGTREKHCGMGRDYKEGLEVKHPKEGFLDGTETEFKSVSAEKGNSIQLNECWGSCRGLLQRW